jgi:GNAT superfamily N-acetyltransferase
MVSYHSINIAHPWYQQVLALRQAVLRTPLGLDLANEDLSDETNQIITVAVEGDNVVGCLMAQLYNPDTYKLRQMAIHPTVQGQGIGHALLQYMEKIAIQNGILNIMFHARSSALNFYLKANYNIEGAAFEEVTIPHYKMTKTLNEAR